MFISYRLKKFLRKTLVKIKVLYWRIRYAQKLKHGVPYGETFPPPEPDTVSTEEAKQSLLDHFTRKKMLQQELDLKDQAITKEMSWFARENNLCKEFTDPPPPMYHQADNTTEYTNEQWENMEPYGEVFMKRNVEGVSPRQMLEDATAPEEKFTDEVESVIPQRIKDSLDNQANYNDGLL